MFRKQYPGLAEWIDDYGWIEIGQDENSGSLVRVLDEGGEVWESSGKITNLDEAFVAAEQFISHWIEELQ